MLREPSRRAECVHRESALRELRHGQRRRFVQTVLHEIRVCSILFQFQIQAYRSLSEIRMEQSVPPRKRIGDHECVEFPIRPSARRATHAIHGQVTTA